MNPTKVPADPVERREGRRAKGYAPPKPGAKAAGHAEKFKVQLFTSPVVGPSAKLAVYSKVRVVWSGSVARLRAQFELTQAELARATGFSLRVIAGWESGKSLSMPGQLKMVGMERLVGALSALVPAGKLGEWMRAPNAAFEGQSPLQVLERGQADRLWRMVFEIDANVAN